MITVDVEAQPARAERDPLERLIWGRYPGEEEAGIGRMMEIADKHGVKLTMFLDYCEEGIYGEGILDVAREIERRGHDLQLHAHLDFMPRSFWANNGLAPEFNLNLVTSDQSKAMFDFLCDAQIRATGRPATAFRGGGYRFNGDILNAMVERGVMLDSSVNVSRGTQPLAVPLSKQFLWSNGCLEVPVSCVEGYRNLGRKFDFNFNAMTMPDPQAMVDCLDVFYRERGEDAVAVLVMHSWSFLQLTDAKHFTRTRPDFVERLDCLLSLLNGNVQVISASDCVDMSRAGRICLDAPQDFERLKMADLPGNMVPKATPEKRGVGVVESGAPGDTAFIARCPICGTSKSAFVDLNGRQCPECRSVERQRIFRNVLSEHALPWNAEGLGRLMVVSPSVSEKRIFQEIPKDELITIDVRPEVGVDVVANICSMPDVSSASFDTVFASYVMMCVYSLEDALSEIHRVLRPGGIFISVEQVRYGVPSVENSDAETIKGWYGSEAFEKYKVGSFRSLGKESYNETLSKYFDVECLEGTDPITGMTLPVYICRKNSKMKSVEARDGLASMGESALLEAAERLWLGTSESGNWEEAITLFERAWQEFASPMAAYRLGCAFYLERGVHKDLAKAHSFLIQPCISGWRYGQYYLGLVLADPSYSGRNVSSAMISLEAASELGVDLAREVMIGLKREIESQVSVPDGTARICNICGFDFSGLPAGEVNCGKCKSRPRTRTVPLVCEELTPEFDLLGDSQDRRVLAFAMPDHENQVISRYFGEVVSASLYGEYRQGHLSGVDARDLSQFALERFDAVFSVLLLDYFVEHEKALEEIHKVLKPGGVFFTHVAPYRLTDSDEPPVNTATIQTRAGYFDYVPSDANMPSIKVGRRWLLAAFDRAGFSARMKTHIDPAFGESVDWFIGVKRGGTKVPRPGLRANQSNTGTDDELEIVRTGFQVQASNKGEVQSAAYRSKLRGNADATGISVTLSALPISPNAGDFYFAEHVYEVQKAEQTNTIILAGTDALLVSDDLGKTWRTVPIPGTNKLRLWNCFTTSSGKHIVQSLGWQGPQDGQMDRDRHAALFIFDTDWKFLQRAHAGMANWHGTASVGQSGSTIMFCEYYNNSERYKLDFDERRSEYLKTLRPCAIWRSQDDGLTWHKTLERGPLEVRHFHTVQADPHQHGVWWATSGDMWWEARAWRSLDNGESWEEVTNSIPDVVLPLKDPRHKASCQRLTDMIIRPDTLIWGADDLLGSNNDYDSLLELTKRSGARLYKSKKGRFLDPVEIGYVGQPVRKMVDVGPGWIVITEAKHVANAMRPQVFFLGKTNMDLTHIFDVENLSGAATGFTYSRGSVKAMDGVFFTFKNYDDAIKSNARCLRWEVKFD
jgi:ubiquinone/menaquinone biosynthesis C-methylase UbiE